FRTGTFWGGQICIFICLKVYWMSGEPNNSGGNVVEEDCAVMSSYERSSALQKWNDVNCSIKRFWVCELKPADQ
uniref:C-type lectin domain-containing protein n=1 Tax=Astyanax mexicanus TaxID=7994 RepID=A0A3B1K4D9_ASTMX